MAKKHTLKNRQKSRVIPGTKVDLSKPPGISANKRKVMGVVIVSVIVLYVINLFTGVVMFSLVTIGCMRLPVAVDTFWNSNDLYRPGDDDYGPSLTRKYFCSVDSAKKRGYAYTDNHTINRTTKY